MNAEKEIQALKDKVDSLTKELEELKKRHLVHGNTIMHINTDVMSCCAGTGQECFCSACQKGLDIDPSMYLIDIDPSMYLMQQHTCPDCEHTKKHYKDKEAAL